MNIVVCVKRVPLTQEVDLEIDSTGKDIKKEPLAYVINDWDHYAIEEAVLLQEKFGGTVTAITIGNEEDEEVLRRALAMGAAKAIRIDPGDLSLDGFVISRLLWAAVKDLPFELVLTGVQANDDNCGMVGVMLAEHLGVAHTAVVTGVEVDGKEAELQIELEGGIEEKSNIELPALLTIQTGINVPRYVSIMGIRKARKKPLEVIKVSELGLPSEDLTPRTMIQEIYLPPDTEGAEMIEGNPSTVAEEIIRILTEKGVNV
ncbi:MAG: electron transfer flavoprotein subunit beta/FixA family protein [Desulfatiglandaceae bacterium]